MKKKFLVMLALAILLALSMAPAAWAYETSGQCGDDVYWRIDNDTLFISGTGAMWEINEEYRSYPWQEYIVNDNLMHRPLSESINKIIIDNGVTTIGNNAFERCEYLTDVKISNTVYSIGNDAFSYCENLEKINIPGSVNAISRDMFRGCSKLSEVNIENGVKYIEERAFYNCTNLKTINMPKSIIRIDENIFKGCFNLIEITVDNANNQYSSYNAALYNKELETLYIYPAGKAKFEISSTTKTISTDALQDCSKLTEIIIPDNVESIDGRIGSAFSGCVSLNKITVSKNLYGDWYYLFYNCESLTEVIMPNKLADSPESWRINILQGTFVNCKKLKEIKIPENVSKLYQTFSGCENLEKIYLPVTIKEITKDTFYHCYNLKEIVYAGTQEQWDTIKIDEGNAELEGVKYTFLNNSPSTEPNKPINPDKPTEPEQPTNPTTPNEPSVLPIESRPGGLGAKINVQVEGGHWLTVQVRRAGTIAITSVQAPGQGKVALTFSAPVGSVVKIWETAEEMEFTNGVPSSKILAVNVKNL